MPTTEITFTQYFADLPDPRSARTRWHRLDDILVIAVCAVLCGADSFDEIERYGKARHDWLKTFLALPNGIPSHDTFNRVLAALDRDQFSACFARWMTDLCAATGLVPIAIDGKACRSAPADTFSGCLHLVNAWAVENHLFLGQAAVPDGGHEITTLPTLLQVLDVKGALVTIDAAGCQKEIVGQIRRQGGDYLVAVKGNQPALQRVVHAAVERACEAGLRVLDGRGDGGRARSIGGAVRDGDPRSAGVARRLGRCGGGGRGRPGAGGGWDEHEYGPLLTSLRASAKELGGYIRGHWGIENGLHWCLDVAFGEDANRTRDPNAGANLGAIRRVAASLLKQDKGKGSMRSKRLNAALDPDCLLRALQGFKAN